MVKLLAINKADVYTNNKDGQTPISLTGENGHDLILKTLLSENTDYTDFEYNNGNQTMIKVENRQSQLERIVEICVFRSNRDSKHLINCKFSKFSIVPGSHSQE